MSSKKLPRVAESEENNEVEPKNNAVVVVAQPDSGPAATEEPDNTA